MISTLATSEQPASVMTLRGTVPIPISAGLYSAGQQLPPFGITSYQDPRTPAPLSLNSLLRSSTVEYAGYQAAVNQIAHGQVFIPTGVRVDPRNCGQEKNIDGLIYQTSADEMEEEESYSSTGGDDKSQNAAGKTGSKFCRVCGDRALGYNFNVVSCESCKAFFRRNALKRKDFRCPFSDNCDVTALSRRFCQKCRLKKCFEVGMKKEWIMSDEQRLQKRKRIEENRQKRRVVAEKAKIKPEEQSESQTSACKTPSETSEGPQQSQQLYSNAGFSPGSKPRTSPVIMGLGSDFSPPDSIDQSQTQCLDDQARIGLCSGKNMPTGQNSLCSSNSLSCGQEVVSGNTIRGSDGDLNTLDLRRQRPSHALESESEHPYLLSPSILAISQPRFVDNMDGLLSPLTASSSASVDLPASCSRCSLSTPVIGQHDPAADCDSMITIPKSVLTNLIKQCHATLHQQSTGAAALDSVSPVVARARRLCDTDGVVENSEAYKCICRCSCGARAAGSIGPKLVDRGTGPDEEVEEKMDVKDAAKAPECADVSMAVDEQNMTVAIPVHAGPFDGIGGGGVVAFETLKMRELFIANQVMDEEPDYSKVAVQDSNTQSPQPAPHTSADGRHMDVIPGMSATDMINMTDVCVRRIIKMCKRICAFRNLCQEDQIALLKGGCTELMILRGVMTFVPEKESWRPVGWRNSLLSLDVLKWVKGNVYQEHKKYLQSFLEEWRTNDNIMLCMAAITLFNPERANVTHTKAVENERTVYMTLLRRYLNLMYGTDSMASQEAFRELIDRVKELRRLNDYTATVFLDMNPGDVEPLLIEVFDLK